MNSPTMIRVFRPARTTPRQSSAVILSSQFFLDPCRPKRATLIGFSNAALLLLLLSMKVRPEISRTCAVNDEQRFQVGHTDVFGPSVGADPSPMAALVVG